MPLNKAGLAIAIDLHLTCSMNDQALSKIDAVLKNASKTKAVTA